MFRDTKKNVEDALLSRNKNSLPLTNDNLKAILKQTSEQKSTRMNLSTLCISNDQAEIIADFLKKNHHLLRLNLSKNNITAKGLAKIGEALMWNHTLTHLDLADNKIYTSDIKELVSALSVNKRLLYINLAFNNIGNQGARLIADAIAENTVIKLIDLSVNKVTYIQKKPNAIFIYDFLWTKKERPLYIPWAEKKHETKTIENAFLFFEETESKEAEHERHSSGGWQLERP